MAKKVYAIKEGFDKENNKKIVNVIVNTWAECQRYVTGVKGAKYKSFENIEDAKRFISDGGNILNKKENKERIKNTIKPLIAPIINPFSLIILYIFQYINCIYINP